MHYYIDGYNLLFRLSFDHTSLQKERERVIEQLTKKIKLLNLHVTLVFDSAYTPGESTQSNIGPLTIIYTSQNQTADDWIIEALYREKKPATLVTSDKKLCHLIRDSGASTLSIEQFVIWLDARARNKKAGKKLVKKTQKPLLLPPLPPEAPTVASNGSSDYYLKAFESELAQMPVLPKKTPQIPKRKKPAPPKEEPSKYSSDYDRWLDLFNNILD